MPKPGSYILQLKEGTVVRSLKDLHHAFYTMSDTMYRYHARQDHNDFSVWIRTALKDKELAHDIKAAKNKVQARTLVALRLRELKTKDIKRKQHQFWKELMTPKSKQELDPIRETQARIEYIKQLIRHDDFRGAYAVVKDIPQVYSKIDKDDRRRHELLYQIIKLKDYVEAFVE